ncbi:thiol S-methyltransferase TMT1A-like [Haliotis cracherodii]|uniref:thiol S-methyltransferase TMT1A-like n=1 Tax=Haliotis cracherodii TaxID=6455 RepID=UPI0039E7B206
MVSVAGKIFIIILFIIGFLVWYKKYKTSPWYLNRLWKTMDDNLRNTKILLFASLHQMRENLNRDLLILEVGSGGGTNFRYYPDGTRVVCLDINAEYFKFVDENLKSQNTQVDVKDVICCNAENLSQFADNTFDAVVSTFVLSSVRKSTSAVEEIRRVLNKEGAFFFIENVFGKIGDKARVVQRVLAPFYPFLFDGIKLMVNTDEVITNCGFSKVDFKRIEFEPPIPLLFPLRSAICGSATK